MCVRGVTKLYLSDKFRTWASRASNSAPDAEILQVEDVRELRRLLGILAASPLPLPALSYECPWENVEFGHNTSRIPGR